MQSDPDHVNPNNSGTHTATMPVIIINILVKPVQKTILVTL